MKEVKLYWWQPPQHSKWSLRGLLSGEYKRYKNIPLNFGDELSAYIVSKILDKKITKANENEKNKLLGIGSVLHKAKDNDTIWGSGINGKYLDRKIEAETLNVLSVRGPKTRSVLLQQGFTVPEIYGDPGILVSQFYKPTQNKNQKEYIFIPHFSEIELAKKIIPSENLVLPTQPLLKVIDDIYQANFVISSSLHGIVIAESYGIKARLFKLTNNEPLFKYEDYYAGTGRNTFNVAHSVEEALEMGGENSCHCDKKSLIKILKKQYD